MLAHKIEDSETDLLVTLDLAVLYPQMARLLGSSRLKKLIVGSMGDYAAQPAGVRAHLQARRAAGRGGGRRPTRRFRLAARQRRRLRGASRSVTCTQAIVVLQYTGGTTGLPKGAMLTHANLSAACAQYMATSQGNPRVLTEGVERVLVVLPLFHIYALTVNLLYGVRLGALLVLHPRFDVDAVIKDLIDKKISLFAGVPTMYMAMSAHPRVIAGDLKSLQFCGSGGAPLPVEVATASSSSPAASSTKAGA